MAAPSTPYVTAVLASMLAKNMFKGQAPSSSTPITNVELEQLITWAEGIIHGAFADLGYVIPFAELSGETWPGWQTVYLQIWAAVGAMSMASGYILLPAPAMKPGDQGGEQNVYATLFWRMYREVKEHGLRFRARYYRGTKAEKLIAEPGAPRTDFQIEVYDPSRYELFEAYTDRMVKFFTEVKNLDIDTDYVRQLLVHTRSGSF